MGYFPNWTLKTSGVVMPDERLPTGQTLIAGLQHVVAMFGATVLAPVLMGFDPNVAIFFSGIATLLFFVITRGQLPSYLGSSFAFIGVVIAATGYAGSGPNANIGVALGGIIACGAVYALIGLIVQGVGTAWIEKLLPPVVTGAVVAAIGLNLTSVAISMISASPYTKWIALFTVVSVALVAVYGRGLPQRLPVLMGFDPNVAIFFSGIATLLFFVITRGQLPSYLGSSFAFIGVVIAATGYAGSGPNPNIGVALGGIIDCGAVYAVIGLIVQGVGTAWIEKLLPRSSRAPSSPRSAST